jgi:hypothetical protein
MPRLIKLPKLPGRSNGRDQTKQHDRDVGTSETHAARLERILEQPKPEAKAGDPSTSREPR